MMAKAARRVSQDAKRAPRTRAQAANARLTNARVTKPRLATVSGELREGFVVAVNPAGTVRVNLTGGPTIDALFPAHIDPRWLAEAAKLAPVAAVFLPARPSGRYVLFGLFPTRAQAEVRVDVTIRGRQVRVDAVELDTRVGQRALAARSRRERVPARPRRHQPRPPREPHQGRRGPSQLRRTTPLHPGKLTRTRTRSPRPAPRPSPC